MKGFIKTIEVVVASIIILIVMNQFIFKIEREPWDKITLKKSLEDSVESIYLTGELNKYVMNNDYEKFHNKLRYMINGPYEFSILIRDLPKPIIKVGCVCNDDEVSNLKSMLLPLKFKYNGRSTEIRINKTSITSNEPDLFFYFNKTKFKEDKNEIKSKLSKRKGILLVSNLSESDMTDLSDVFGFEPETTTKTDSYYSNDIKTISFHISKIFVKCPFRVETSGSENEQTGYIILRNQNYEIKTFTNSTCRNCVEYPIDSGNYYKEGDFFDINTDADTYAIYVEKVQANSTIGETYADLSISNITYKFKTPSVLGSKQSEKSILFNGENSLSTTNSMATWVYGIGNNSDENQFLKSLVLYTSGEFYRLDPDFFDITKPSYEPKGKYISVKFVVAGYNGLDPYIVILRSWSAFM